MSEFFTPGVPCEPAQAPMWDWARMAREGLNEVGAGWSTPEAFLALLIAGATCDGANSSGVEELQALVHRSRALKTLGTEQMAAANAKVLARLQREPDAIAAAAAALPGEMRASLFAHVLDIVLADGELSQRESAFLNALVTYLQLDRQLVQRIADVIILKNRY